METVPVTEAQVLSFPVAAAESLVEEWRVIPGSEGYYSVSRLGRVRSEPVQTSRTGRQRGRILTCGRDSKGYLQFRMCLPGGRHRTMKAHRAVALAFLGPRPPGAQINHISGDKTDNSVANLEYVSCKQNVRHAWRTGLSGPRRPRGARHGRSKLNADAVRQIRMLADSTSLTALAQRFGVTLQCIDQVIKRKTWQHVA